MAKLKTPAARDLAALTRLQAEGRTQEALELAQSLIQRQPSLVLPWKVVGSILQDRGRHAEAEPYLEAAVKRTPSEATLINQLGVSRLHLGRPAEARALFERATQLQPDLSTAHGNLGIACHALQEIDAAARHFRQALALRPDSAQNLGNLGAILLEQRRHAEAQDCFERALALAPHLAGLHGNLGMAHLHRKNWPGAEASLNRALALQPDLFQAHEGLALLWRERGNLSAAEASCRRALALAPRDARTLTQLGMVLSEQGRAAEAADCLMRAVEAAPDDAHIRSSQLFCLAQDESVEPDELFRRHRAFGLHFEATQPPRAAPHRNNRDPARPLRVGFVSGDLRDHSVAYFVEPLWRALDPAQIEIWAYHTCGSEDAISQRLRGLSRSWSQAEALSDEQLAARIEHDAIDVLFDLSGHTTFNRLLMFCRKPAPVQVTWLGYPHTTGLAAMDYLLCDRFNAPHGWYEHFYTEHFARIPAGNTFASQLDAPPVGALPMRSRGHVTFGSFNRISKLGNGVIAAWARVLNGLPDARLVIGNVTDASVRQRLTERLGEQGVAAERLGFHPRLPLDDYLRLHQGIDIVLDTWPYTGGTTTNHALWMGVPVLTLRGPSRSHCQAASVLGRLGLDDWVADDVEGFIARAVQKARDPDALEDLRAGMRERWEHAPLRQPAVVARGFEAGVRQMWQRWCEGLPPAHLDVAIDEAVGRPPDGVAASHQASGSAA